MNTVALITGAASGIGAAVARRLSANGVACVLVDRDGEGVERIAQEVRGVPVAGDVSSPETSLRAVALAQERYGRLDLVHLNAGTNGGLDMSAFDAERYRTVMGVNVDAVVYGVAAALPLLKNSGGGSIVVTSSLAGLVGFGIDPIYSMSKHATVGLVRALAEPLSRDGVRIGAVCPGFTDTPLVAPVKDMMVQAGIPMLTAEDVASAVEAALYADTSGTTLVVQPGMAPTPYQHAALPAPAAG
ncbi:oxidoreductase [Acrocarpospora phusangensis]|uniref:Oxidoreductase n=1 Tax=Acrocarpospora phusangensis TaxID=1070424 RepID=A0A919QHL8_9ACTN|nr:SDR family oxidoreductase [Acrocarpospora phusangensis]GIH26590.1 oxidoreductase [Acrocarpospora phusangensis]